MVTAVRLAFQGLYWAVVLLFLSFGAYLVGVAALNAWQGLASANGAYAARFDVVLRSIGFLTIAVAALELGQTVLDEEVLRNAHVSGPTRVRRFVSRFLVVVIVALSVESLVAVFHHSIDHPEQLPNAAAIAASAALLLAAWGVFVHLNRSAEMLEPESMEETKREDEAVKAQQ